LKKINPFHQKLSIQNCSHAPTPVPSAETLRPIIMPSAQHLISFHLVTAGGCWAIPQGSEPVRLEVGDVVVFPGGDPRRLRKGTCCIAPKPFLLLTPVVSWRRVRFHG
jgi:Cupin